MLELLEPPWIAARKATAKRTSFFTHLLTLSARGMGDDAGMMQPC
jgi:hypothetical protein